MPCAPFDMEEPWATPPACAAVRFRSAMDGAAPRLTTTLSLWFDASCLSILFSASDDHVRASFLEHDAPLYEEDVVEAFLAPQGLTEYFELEVSPLGTLFDARIESPDGIRRTMRADRAWTCAGMVALLRATTESDGTITRDTLIRVPFASLGRPVPADGEQWRANFFRIDRHPMLGDEYTAWQPTMRKPADFHVAAAFGVLEFQGSSQERRR